MCALANDPEERLRKERAQFAEFGLLAVEGADLDGLLQQAAAEAARSLDVSHVKVLQYLPDEKRLLVRAGVGWGEGVVGQARIGADIESPAGYALQTGRPVISKTASITVPSWMSSLLSFEGMAESLLKSHTRRAHTSQNDSRPASA